MLMVGSTLMVVGAFVTIRIINIEV